MRRFSDLSEREILALAIALEEEHGRIYAEYATGLADSYPASAKVFTQWLTRKTNTGAGSSICSAKNSAITFR
jgi:Rubrerythrin